MPSLKEIYHVVLLRVTFLPIWHFCDSGSCSNRRSCFRRRAYWRHILVPQETSCKNTYSQIEAAGVSLMLKTLLPQMMWNRVLFIEGEEYSLLVLNEQFQINKASKQLVAKERWHFLAGVWAPIPTVGDPLLSLTSSAHFSWNYTE